MVDHVRINAMSGGDLIAADDIDGVKHQRVRAVVLPGATVGAARVTVPAAGNPVSLGDRPQAGGVTIRAALANTGMVFLGGADVSAGTGFELAPGEAISVDVANTSAIYLDAEKTGDGVCLLWVSV